MTAVFHLSATIPPRPAVPPSPKSVRASMGRHSQIRSSKSPMSEPSNEENLLRSAALKNANSILQARRRAEEELVQAKAALEFKSAELAGSLALVQATLESAAD